MSGKDKKSLLVCLIDKKKKHGENPTKMEKNRGKRAVSVLHTASINDVISWGRGRSKIRVDFNVGAEVLQKIDEFKKN